MRILWYIKKHNLIIFQSSFQAKLFIKYNENVLVDGTFYIVSNFSYQVLITRAYGDLYYFLFDIKKNKEQATYEI